MLSDRDLIEENTELLLQRWRLLKRPGLQHLPARLGMDLPLIQELRAMDEIHVRRAADCSAPIFKIGAQDEVILSALEDRALKHEGITDELDNLIASENHLVLTNRWGAARYSPVHAQCTLGMSDRLVTAFRKATVRDLHRVAASGIRFAKMAPAARYFFHAGRNPSLQKANRTTFAVCASATLV